MKGYDNKQACVAADEVQAGIYLIHAMIHCFYHLIF